MLWKVDKLTEIDWEEFYPVEDSILYLGEEWHCSEFVAHLPGQAGIVIENKNLPKRYIDSASGKELAFFPFPGEFLAGEEKGEIDFLLPLEWDDNQRQAWYEQYKNDRLAQEETREQMLSGDSE
jgi:hypothetical protein